MSITLNAVSPIVLDGNGGAKLTIEGDFAEHLGQPFFVELVPAVGDVLVGLTGRPGNPTEVSPLNSEKMVCYAPQATPGATYDLRVRRTDDSVSDTLAGVFTVLPKQYNTAVFSLRSILPPNYKTGPRNVGLLERI